MPDAAPPWRQRLQRSWYSAQPHPLLTPLSWIYGAAVRLRDAAYRTGLLRSHHPGVPVVVIGNISVGGTGKTPLTLWLTQQLQAAGVRVGIATRGYGREAQGVEWATADSDPLQVGDEPVLLARRSGALVCVARRRFEAATRLVQRGCNLVLCDDGLQHRALRRDMEIAVVDGQRGFGNGALLPAGPLRESPAILRRVALIVITGEGTPQGIPAGTATLRMTLRLDQLRALTGVQSRVPTQWQGQSVHAVAGIGHPQRFFAALREYGLEVEEHAYPDHHHFVSGDLQFADQRSIVMTEKDAVKCQSFADSRMWVAPVTAQFSAADARQLLAAVQGLIAGQGVGDA
jgi:tetraacyldisaccharide 4'-kinase